MVRVLVRLDRGSTSFTNKAFMRQKLEARKSQSEGKSLQRHWEMQFTENNPL